MSEVPTQFKGLARVAIARIDAAAVVAADGMRKLREATFQQYQRRAAPPRPEFIADLERRWRSLPSLGSLGIQTERGDASALARKGFRHTQIATFSICEVRVTGCSVTHPDWLGDQREQALCIVRTRLELQRNRANYSGEIIAGVCFHGLSRFMERSFINSDEALMDELKSIVAATSTTNTMPEGV
jgi:hypothetical protein